MGDHFEVLIDPAAVVRWPEGGGFQPAEVRINGCPLIELVRAAEVPWVRAEYLERLSEFENPKEFRFEPGDYHYLAALSVLLPSREWLGAPSDPGFVLDTDDPRRGKAMVLGCTCGISECWFIQARIDVGPKVVRWSEFRQFHRPEWVYELGPFTFDRRQYEAQLAPRLAGQLVASSSGTFPYRLPRTRSNDSVLVVRAASLRASVSSSAMSGDSIVAKPSTASLQSWCRPTRSANTNASAKSRCRRRSVSAATMVRQRSMILL